MAVVKRPKKKDGKIVGYSYGVVVYDQDGNQKWCGTYHTKKDALAKDAKVKASLAKGGVIVVGGKETFGEFLDRWLRDYAEPNLAPTTLDEYRTIIERHIRPALGNIRLSKLRPAHLTAYLGEKRKAGRVNGKGGLSNKYLIQHYAIIHKALECAVKWEMVGRNVADAVDRPKEESKKMSVLNEKQAAKVLAAAEGTTLYPVILLALATGMRRGEILGLRWQDIDMEQGLVRVQQTLQMVRREGGGYEPRFLSPKTEKSRRTISLPPGTVEHLKRWQRRQKELRLKAGPLFEDRGLVCCRYDGSPLDPREISKRVAALIKKKGFNCTLHGLRHSHVSLLIAKNIHLKVISERLGHTNISTTSDIYGHILAGADEQAAAVLGKIFDDEVPAKKLK